MKPARGSTRSSRGGGGGALGPLLAMARKPTAELLAALKPFTDAKAPAEPPPPVADDAPALLYVIRPGVMKTTGKAANQQVA